MSRVMDKPGDFTLLGVNPDRIEVWEDGRRDTSQPGHAEIWYFDCHFDDGSTLVLGFRPKSVDQVDKDGDNPNVAINYNYPDGTLASPGLLSPGGSPSTVRASRSRGRPITTTSGSTSARSARSTGCGAARTSAATTS